MYEKPPTDAELAALGLLREDLDDAAVDLWPENERTVDVFVAMATQWRMGFAGPTGLDYAALPFVMRMIGVPASERQDVFEGFRTMENAALDEIHKDRT